MRRVAWGIHSQPACQGPGAGGELRIQGNAIQQSHTQETQASFTVCPSSQDPENHTSNALFVKNEYVCLWAFLPVPFCVNLPACHA